MILPNSEENQCPKCGEWEALADAYALLHCLACGWSQPGFTDGAGI